MFVKIFIFLFTIVLPRSITGKIYQSSNAGEIAKVTFDMSVGGGSSQCCDLRATGNITLLATTLNFDSSFFDFFSEASDMFIVVNHLNSDGSVIECAMFGGYDYDYSGCGKVGHWPSGWESTSNKKYTSTADMTRTEFSGNLWSICVGNGWSGNLFSVGYSGEISFSTDLMTYSIPPTVSPTQAPTESPTLSYAPTHAPFIYPTVFPTKSSKPSVVPSLWPSAKPSVSSAPTLDPLEIASDCSQTVEVSFDALLSGGESVCQSFAANRTLSAINITMNYGGGNDDEVVGDFVFVVYHTGDLLGVQVGGHEYYVPTVNYVGPWPATWQNNTAGVYKALENVSSYNLGGSKNSSGYLVCITNGWYYADREHYAGTALLEGLVHECSLPPPTLPPFVSPTSYPTRLPTNSPSSSASNSPSPHPTLHPSAMPTKRPLVAPTYTPTTLTPPPSPSPTKRPLVTPTYTPTTASQGLMPTPAAISVSSDVGETTSVGFDVELSSGERVDVDTASSGTLALVSVQVDFAVDSAENPSALLADMIVLVKEISSTGLDDVSGVCVKIGGADGFTVSDDMNCMEVHEYSWPESFNTAVSGSYAASVDVSFSALSGSGMWKISIINGANYDESSSTAEATGAAVEGVRVVRKGIRGPASVSRHLNSDGGVHYDGQTTLSGFVTTSTTVAPTLSPTIESNSRRSNNNNDDDADDTGAILAGTLVPVFIIGGIVAAWCVYKSRKSGSNTSHTDENGVSKEGSDLTRRHPSTELFEIPGAKSKGRSSSNSAASAAVVSPLARQLVNETGDESGDGKTIAGKENNSDDGDVAVNPMQQKLEGEARSQEKTEVSDETDMPEAVETPEQVTSPSVVAERVVGVDKQFEERDTPRGEDAVVSSRDPVIEQSSTEPKEEDIVEEGDDGLRDTGSGSEELDDSSDANNITDNSPDANSITDDANIKQVSKEEEADVGVEPSMEEDEEVQEKKANSTDSEEITVAAEGVSKDGGEGEKSFEVEANDEDADGDVMGDNSGSPSDDEERDDDTPVEVTLADDSGEK